jgi:LuxR family maltose regulon positive regulatory protein
MLGTSLVWQGRPEEAEPWVQRAERTVRAEAEPATAVGVLYVRGLLELARGRDADALAALRAAERLAGRLAAPHQLVPRVRAVLVHALVRLGETERAEKALADLGERDRDSGEMRTATAVLRLAQDDPAAAVAVLAPVLDGSRPLLARGWLARAFLLEAIARDALGDGDGADRALERALDCAEPDGTMLPFLLHRVPDLFLRHVQHRTAHAALIAEIQGLLAARKLAAPPDEPRPPLEPLRESELRVLRYLPTNLTAQEIATELSVSRHTVKTHIRNLYAKLGTHRRGEAVARARDLGLLAPITRRR